MGPTEASLKGRYSEVHQRLMQGIRITPTQVPKPAAVSTVAEVEPEPDDDVVVYISPIRWKQIVHEVAQKHGMSVVELISRRRNNKIILARHEVFYRLRQETRMSFPDIARRMGGWGHTTVMHGAARHEQRMKEGA